MPRKKPARRHDYRGDAGRFAPKPQRTISTPQGTRQSTAGVNPFAMSVQQQAWLAGATPGWWISDHLEELRHFVSWIYVGVHKIAQQWAQATVNVYDDNAKDTVEKSLRSSRFRHRPDILEMARLCRRWRTKSHTPDTQAEQETPVPDHPAALKLERPNPYTSGPVFRYQVACQLRLTGGAFIWEVPNQYVTNGRAEPEHLWVIPRGWARPMAPSGQYPEGWFQITPVFNTFTQGVASPSLSNWIIPYAQMIDVRYPNPLYPGEGTSPLTACSQIIDIMEQTDTATWASFLNSVKPSLVFSIDPKSGALPTEEQLKQFMAELEAFKSGANNAGKVLAMLGLSVQQMMNGPAELDYVNGRDQNRKNVFGIQGVAETVAGFGASTSYSEAAVAAKTTIEFSVEPDLQIFGGALTHRWSDLWPGTRIELTAKAINDPELQLQKTDKIAAGYTAMVVSDNEYRASLDLPPLDDPIADIPKCLLQTMLPEIGAPDTGIPGMGDESDPYAAFGGVDTADELPSATSTGTKKPELQEAGGRMAKVFGLNGFASNGVHK